MPGDLTVRINDLVPEFITLLERSDPGRVFSHTIAATQHVAEMYLQVWRNFAQGYPVPGAPRIINSASYARSIKLADLGPYTKEVYTDSQYHAQVERGRPEVDLKKGLLSGPKSRPTKYGGRYNIVPFRHSTPKAKRNPMPLNIYRMILSGSKKAEDAKRQGLSDRGGFSKVTRDSAQPQDRAYEWGYNVDRMNQQGRQSKITSGYTWKAGKYAGMVRMQASTTGAARSKYLTFRVVSSRSDPRSWILPRLEPIPIRQAVLDRVNPIAREMFREALEADLS